MILNTSILRHNKRNKQINLRQKMTFFIFVIRRHTVKLYDHNIYAYLFTLCFLSSRILHALLKIIRTIKIIIIRIIKIIIIIKK